MTHATLSTRSTSRRGLSKRVVNLAPWSRPLDWPLLPEIGETTKQFSGLLAVNPGTDNYVAFTCAGAYTVDWGDGSAPENVATGVQANHQYDYAVVSSAVTARGYKTVIVTITPQAGQNLTSIDLQKKYSVIANLSAYESGWLEISLTSQALTTLAISKSGTKTVAVGLLESVRIGPNAVTNWSNMFDSCYNLKAIHRLTTGLATNMSAMFSSCRSLVTVPLFDTAVVTNMSTMFSGCSALTMVPLFNTVSVLNMTSMFQDCGSLVTVPLFNVIACTSFNFMFQNCVQLREMPPFSPGANPGWGSMFVGCVSLVKVPMLTLRANTILGSMFSGCRSLAEFPPWDVTNANGTQSMFQDCTSLVKQPPLIGLETAVITKDSMFQGCTALTSIIIEGASPGTATVPGTNVGSTLNLAASCPSLVTVKIGGSDFHGSVIGKLGLTALNNYFYSLPKAQSTSKSISVSSNYGYMNNTFSKSITATAGSPTVTLADTSNLAVGQNVSSTHFGDITTLAIDTAANTITRTAHGYVDGMLVALMALATSTGLSIFTPYFVVNATANTIQLSLTLGGAPIDITGANGTCTLRHDVRVMSIVPNTSVTLNMNATGSGTVTATFSNLNRAAANLKGWAGI